LDAAATAVSPASAVQTAKDVLRNEPLMSLDYVALVDEDSFEEIAEGFPARSGRMLIAVRVGSTRLIDNALLTFGQ
jgi:pantothenate synthetase